MKLTGRRPSSVTRFGGIFSRLICVGMVSLSSFSFASLMPSTLAQEGAVSEDASEQANDAPVTPKNDTAPVADGNDDDVEDTKPVIVDDYTIFTHSQDVSAVQLTYEEVVGFLNSYSAIDKGRVKINYKGIRAGGASTLARIIRDMRDVPVEQLTKSDQLAYWLNMRNLLVLFAVTIDGQATIEAERGTFDAPGEMWTKEMITVRDVSLSIDDIERHIILANWSDPNLVYGLYQGTAGGPALYKPGFTGQTVNVVLKKLGQRYVNTKNTLRGKTTTLQVPQVYEWYKPILFDNDNDVVLTHIKKLALPKMKKKLSKFDMIVPTEFSYKVESIDQLRKIKSKQSRPAPSAPPRQQPRSGRRSGS